MFVLSEHWIFFYSCNIMSFLFSSNVVFFLVGFSFFYCRRCFVYIYSFITLVSGSVNFLACWVPGGFSGGPGHAFLLRGAPLSGVSVRYYLFEC